MSRTRSKARTGNQLDYPNQPPLKRAPTGTPQDLAAMVKLADKTGNLIPEHGSINWRYRRATDGHGREMRFCWSVGRNAAGYFLAWREYATADGTIHRTDWTAHRKKSTCAEICANRASAWVPLQDDVS